jgi:putative hydrolase of the HAD superfamily
MNTPGLIFLDLDDTLYPQTSGLWEAIGVRILRYMTERVGIHASKADELRAKYLHQYGTTLNGLRVEHHIDPHDYLEYVHEVPIEQYILPDPALREALAQLPQKLVIFTNASSEHAQRVLRRLGIEGEIDDMIDITRLNFINKPMPEAYKRALKIVDDPDPKTCVMVDDRGVNLLPGSALGMRTVLVGRNDSHSGIDVHIEHILELPGAINRLARLNASDGP